jgi:dihydrofolate synthase/folylpolyglutamate synthase
VAATLSYADVLGKLVGARRFGMKLGLERMRELLDRLGAPDRRLGTVIHVAGTNGKGSTVAMLAALAASSGARVATYTSPHLSTLRERIVIDGAMVSEADIAGAYARVEAAGSAELTFFEQVTAIALVLIADAGVDVTVLEVGLGGRLDATNAVAADIAVITGVAFDHEAILGNTLDAIAFEKAGICKLGQPVVIGACGEPAAVPLLVAHARAAGAREPIVVPADAFVPPVGLAGAHQRRNAALALAVMHALGRTYDASALATVRHPGRFEVIDAQRLILDGAHNPHGARALAAALRDRRGAGSDRPALVLAVSADKDLREIASALVPEAGALIATRYQQERATDPEVLAEVLREVCGDLGVTVAVEAAADLATALERARTRGEWTVVAGSLFIVGEARALVLGAPTDPIVATDPVTPRT